MNKTNVLLLLTPKADLACLNENMSVRQALEKMRAHRYSAIPVISKKGEYVGSVTEGDLLYCLMDEDGDLDNMIDISIMEILRKGFMPSVKVNASIEELVGRITEQNYVPVVDDRNILMGIVTRKSVIKELINNEA